MLWVNALLHRLPWPRGSTYDSVSHMYVRYVTKKYCRVAIVFNGHNGYPTTKDATHLRRTGDYVVVTVRLARGMMVKSKKDECLNNTTNTQQSIHYLSGNLDRAGCTIQ